MNIFLSGDIKEIVLNTYVFLVEKHFAIKSIHVKFITLTFTRLHITGYQMLELTLFSGLERLFNMFVTAGAEMIDVIVDLKHLDQYNCESTSVVTENSVHGHKFNILSYVLYYI